MAERISICEVYDPPTGEVYARYDSSNGDSYALGRHSGEWTQGQIIPFPSAIAALTAIHCIPVPEAIR